MAADSKESVILQGYAKTGVTQEAQQSIILQGYHSPIEPPPVTGGNNDIYHTGHHCMVGRSVLRI